MSGLFLHLRQNYGAVLAITIFLILFTVFLSLHPRGPSVYVMTTASNTGAALAFVAMGQTLPVLTGGLDLSIGSILALCNALASEVVNGSPERVALGVILVLLTGFACGLINGIIVVYGRIQPIIATLASGAVYTGLALLIRPIPGGEIDDVLSEAMTYETFGVVADLAPADRGGRGPNLDFRSRTPCWAAASMPPAHRRLRPTCPACGSTGRSSQPTRSPACSRRSAGYSSASRPSAAMR